tara:strand:+ start:62 stop:208 length:147 start_codon:yes stop_codon:yes gene_type:complete
MKYNMKPKSTKKKPSKKKVSGMMKKAKSTRAGQKPKRGNRASKNKGKK